MTAIYQSTPSPLRGGIKGGGRLALLSGLSYPLPTSPIKGEVPFRVQGTIQSRPPRHTSPLMGEAGRGWGRVTGFLGLLLLPFLAVPTFAQEAIHPDEKCLANDACALLSNGKPDFARIEGEVLEVIDADSLRLKLHLLPGLEYTVVVRSLGVDAPELRGWSCEAEHDLAETAKHEVERKFEVSRWVFLENVQYDKFGGRVLADIYRWDSDRNKTLTKELIETGRGVEYDGQGPRHDWCADEFGEPE